LLSAKSSFLGEEGPRLQPRGIMALLEADHLGRRFDERWIFRKVSFCLEPGHVLAVTGKNGQGKSTLLKIVCGLMEPSEGKVLLEATLGVATLDLALYPSLTAGEHIAFVSELAGISSDPRTALGRVGLSEAVDRPAQALSTGMRARLKLALALVGDPAVLILDEPTAALDEEGRGLVMDAIRSVTSRGGAVLMATNDRTDLEFATHELALR
jgi:heme exporter protein A